MKPRLLISVTLLWVSCASASPNSNESLLKRVGNDGLPLALLLSSPPEALQRMDIAKMNLLCVQELPGTLPMEVDQCLAKLDKWAVRSRIESERHQYRFARSPGEFEHSEGFFKMLILAVVLVEDFGVHYVPTRQLDQLRRRMGMVSLPTLPMYSCMECWAPSGEAPAVHCPSCTSRLGDGWGTH